MAHPSSTNHPASPDRLQVLFITSWYPDHNNPVGGIFIQEHAKAVRLYDDIAVLHLQGASREVSRPWQIEQETDEALSQGIRTYRLRYRPSPWPHTSFLLGILRALQAFRHIRRHGFTPDILHAHIHRAGLAAVFIGRLYQIPVLITEQNSAFPRGLHHKADILLAKFAFSNASAVLPVSLALQKSIERYGIRANWRIVPNAVDTGLFVPRPFQPRAEYRLLFAGGLTPVKGLPFLFEALAGLRQERCDWRLDILGDGPYRALYQQQVEALHLEDKIDFHGLKPKSAVAAFMHQADLFVLPSLWDNMPSVLVEAMACGNPIVSTRTGGIPEIVSAETGLLAPPEDADGLRQAIGQALERLPQYDRLAIAADAQRYNYRAVGGLLHSLYHEALRRRKA